MMKSKLFFAGGVILMTTCVLLMMAFKPKPTEVKKYALVETFESTNLLKGLMIITYEDGKKETIDLQPVRNVDLAANSMIISLKLSDLSTKGYNLAGLSEGVVNNYLSHTYVLVKE
jgi:hypothetical protein